MGYSGFFTVPSASGKRLNNIFFLYQECKTCTAESPVILWLQGGPGGPGTFGAYCEIGNWWVDSDLNIQPNDYSWCKEAHCIFVDQPVATGFSFQSDLSGNVIKPADIEYTNTSPLAMEQVYQLVQQYFKVFGNSANPFYITGESYGGQYTGHLAKVIVDHNANGDNTLINFKGLALGDPILNSELQWPTYPSTLYGMGLVMENERDHLVEVFNTAVEQLHQKNCPKAFDAWNSVWNDNGGGGSPGLFWKYTGSAATMMEPLLAGNASFDNMNNLFKKSEAQKAFHFAGIPYVSTDEGGAVYQAFVDSGDICADSSHLYADLFLNHKIELMIYSSNMDPLLGPPTTQAGIQAMWNNAQAMPQGPALRTQYYNSPLMQFSSTKELGVAGYSRCVDNQKDGNRFCFVIVRNAGHMTPSYQPRAAYDMFMRFMHKDTFQGLPTKNKVPTTPQCSGATPFTGLGEKECLK